MSDGSQAVFLSYASQDAAAALRICEALRAAGVEVWFDQNELVGGDAWDAKIRKQIKDCALFVPIISATTQARAEGYFRREWKLAVERTHDMADHVAFLVPVVIDGTGDAEAFVPEKFREMQWTRLPNGEATKKFCDRVQSLLRGGPAPAAAAAAPARVVAPRAVDRPRSRWLTPVVVGAVVVAAAGVWLWPGRPAPSAAPGPNRETATTPLSATAGAPLTAAQKLARQARDLIDDPMDVRENYFLADEFARRAVAADPTDGEAWAIAGRVSALMVRRKFDLSPARQEQMRMQVERAMSLAPNSIESALALASRQEVADRRGEAQRTLEDLAKRAPTDPRVWLELSRHHLRRDRSAETLVVLRQAQALSGGDGRAAALEAHTLVKLLRPAEARVKFDQAFAARPSRIAYFYRLLMLSIYLYDVEEAKAFIEKIPARVMQEDSVISTVAEFFLRTGDGDRALAELKRMPRDFFEDGWDWRPKGYLAGYAHKIAGRAAAAQAEWKQALAVVEKRLAVEPNESALLYWKCVLQALTGQVAEAAAGRKLLRELDTARENYEWFDAILLVALGERAAAIDLMVSYWPKADAAMRNDLWGDFLYAPWLAAIREDPRIRAMALEHKTAIAAALKPGAAEVVAILPFTLARPLAADTELADTLHDEVVTALQHLGSGSLRLLTREAVQSFRGTTQSNRKAMARQLGAAALVEVTLLREGTRMKIEAQQVNAQSGTLEWSETFHAEVESPDARAALPGLLAQKIAAALRVEANGTARVAQARPPTRNAEAYALYRQVRLNYADSESQRTLSDEDKIKLLRAAVAKDPGFVAAYAQLVDVHALMYWFTSRDRSPARKSLAKEALDHAVRLAPDSAETQFARGIYLYRCERDFRRALEAFVSAEESQPGDADVKRWTAQTLRRLGRLKEALTKAEEALVLDPRNRSLLELLTETCFQFRRFEEAADYGRRFVDVTRRRTSYRWLARSEYEVSGDKAKFERDMFPADPAAAGSASVRGQYHAALFRRDFAEAGRLLDDPRLWPELFVTSITPSLGSIESAPAVHRANLALLRGDRETAKAQASEALKRLAREVQPEEDGYSLRVAMAEMMAVAGRGEEAVVAMKRELAELAKRDAFEELKHRHRLACVYAAAGMTREALDLIALLMQQPCDATPSELREEPMLARLHALPEFERILASARKL